MTAGAAVNQGTPRALDEFGGRDSGWHGPCKGCLVPRRPGHGGHGGRDSHGDAWQFSPTLISGASIAPDSAQGRTSSGHGSQVPRFREELELEAVSPV